MGQVTDQSLGGLSCLFQVEMKFFKTLGDQMQPRTAQIILLCPFWSMSFDFKVLMQSEERAERADFTVVGFL